MERPFVYFGLACGRWFLQVGGVVVAMEGDPCRDISTAGNTWDHDNLMEAGKKIQANLLQRIGQDKELA